MYLDTLTITNEQSNDTCRAKQICGKEKGSCNTTTVNVCLLKPWRNAPPSDDDPEKSSHDDDFQANDSDELSFSRLNKNSRKSTRVRTENPLEICGEWGVLFYFTNLSNR
ncbi:hypothetical protein TNCT_571201 [Trichonephila clavata]|uniref:Uncharacterized protein n=1 Tax=Trichonephila clavata TaxID=2740835 RepID=A0A8X6M1M1_TRICU|nr:hypothetical protein TNCT_571201 [Trichonephila clavata]